MIKHYTHSRGIDFDRYPCVWFQKQRHLHAYANRCGAGYLYEVFDTRNGNMALKGHQDTIPQCMKDVFAYFKLNQQEQVSWWDFM